MLRNFCGCLLATWVFLLTNPHHCVLTWIICWKCGREKIHSFCVQQLKRFCCDSFVLSQLKCVNVEVKSNKKILVMRLLLYLRYKRWKAKKLIKSEFTTQSRPYRRPRNIRPIAKVGKHLDVNNIFLLNCNIGSTEYFASKWKNSASRYLSVMNCSSRRPIQLTALWPGDFFQASRATSATMV